MASNSCPLLDNNSDMTTPALPDPLKDSTQRRNSGNQSRSVGRAAKKQVLQILDIAALIMSLACLCLGVLTINPHFSYAWELGFTGQIVVIGLLLSIMNLCMLRVIPTSFILCEAVLGTSRLQNFEAILTNNAYLSHTGLRWRIIILLFMVLPLGLSVAYKRFLGGVAAVSIKSLNGTYSSMFPEAGLRSVPANAIYLQISSYESFGDAARVNSPFPSEPFTVYGCNTVLINSTASAILDIPTSTYIKNIRSKLYGNESWELSAEVEGYVSTLNQSSDALRANDSFWNTTINSSGRGMAGVYLYTDQATSVGMAPFIGNSSSWISIYSGGTPGWFTLATAGEPEATQFRTTAQLYDVRRRRFNARWHINATSIELLSASEAERQTGVDQSRLSQSKVEPYLVDAVPSLSYVFQQFANNTQSPWLNSSYATTISTAYWARQVFLNIRYNRTLQYEYNTGVETTVSTRHTLQNHALLYLVLAIQPLITICAFILTTTFYHVPIGKGFGVVAMLAGVDEATLSVLHGAGLSGETTVPVMLHISLQAGDSSSIPDDVSDDIKQHVSYSLSTTTKGVPTQRVSRRVKYS